MISYNAPDAARTDLTDTGTSSNKPSKLFKPLPHKAGEKATNELYIPLYQPDKWGIFNNTPEEAARLGLFAGNPIAPAQGKDPIYTYHFKLPVHTIEKFARPDGTTGYTSFICPNSFNSYLTSIWQRSPLFQKNDCPFCVARNQAWEEHNQRWEVVLAEKGMTQKPKGDDYHNIVKNDEILRDTHQRATKTFGLTEKHIVNVIDYGKVSGKVPLADGEEISHQYWMAPYGVNKMLNEYYEEAVKDERMPFFVHNPEGLTIIKVKKDTSKCKGNNFRETEYTVLEGQPVKVDDAWFQFMTNLDLMADPSEIVQILSYEEMARYTMVNTASANVPAESMNQYVNTGATTTTMQAPPMIPNQTQQAPPVQAQQVQQAPPVATTQAPPVQAQQVQQAPPVATTQAPPVQAQQVQQSPPVQGAVVPSMTPPVPGMNNVSFQAPDRGDDSDQGDSW